MARKPLYFAMALSLLLWPPLPAQAQSNLLRNPPVPQAKDLSHAGEKRLKLYNLHTHERIDVVFWRNGGYVPEGMGALNHFLRDFRTGEDADMDRKVLMLVHDLYRHVGATGHIEIISGYRSPETNRKLGQEGRNVAKRSLHTLGMAMDIRMPGVPLKKLAKAAADMKRGGVGFYPHDGFIHVDTGRVRYW